MALTPEDVVNKQFQHVKFREGYDVDQVDDFLDEVVVELRRLNEENDSLRQKLSVAEQRVAELEAKGPQGEDADATQAMPAAVGAPKKEEAKPVVAPQQPAAQAEPAQAEAPKEETPKEDAAKAEAPKADVADAAKAGEETQVAPAVATPAAKPVAAPAAPAASATAPAAAPVSSDKDAHGLIALAQRVHDEHVAEGEKTRDRLIGDAKKKAADIVSEAQKKRDETLQQLESQKVSLEKDIDGLQNFERQYRTRLKSYLTDQLRDLESSGSLAPETLSKNTNQSL
ncbi:DivIVA domain-containing protein [Brevibacterium sp. UMB1308A]|uniref:DivIVA domain-containing protein n=1 Tax=Brevibacterium sp. UMB1308A TaxID=3050608 RepID=UPI00254FB53A|nr:DivIVA domain-containing protein [Brevibacterium sp. UMB1308A]MDK8346432.1 DivIVA domain-containing protein [Brevibacterium sp. UMB1308B]MDK8713317.1 DivIVA domain-containing protein [Brevibacterium sp. UMB1308A]